MANSTVSSARKSQGTKTQVKKEKEYNWEFLHSFDRNNPAHKDAVVLKVEDKNVHTYHRAYVSLTVETDNYCCGHRRVVSFAQVEGYSGGVCKSKEAFEEAWELLVNKLIMGQYMYSGNISTLQADSYPGIMKALEKRGATFVVYNNGVHAGRECIFFYLPNKIKKTTKAKNDTPRQ